MLINNINKIIVYLLTVDRCFISEIINKIQYHAIQKRTIRQSCRQAGWLPQQNNWPAQGVNKQIPE
jgi:hypothetical protein